MNAVAGRAPGLSQSQTLEYVTNRKGHWSFDRRGNSGRADTSSIRPQVLVCQECSHMRGNQDNAPFNVTFWCSQMAVQIHFRQISPSSETTDFSEKQTVDEKTAAANFLIIPQLKGGRFISGHVCWNEMLLPTNSDNGRAPKWHLRCSKVALIFGCAQEVPQSSCSLSKAAPC